MNYRGIFLGFTLVFFLSIYGLSRHFLAPYIHSYWLLELVSVATVLLTLLLCVSILLALIYLAGRVAMHSLRREAEIDRETHAELDAGPR